MDEQEMYDRVCNPRFDSQDNKLDKILIALKGETGAGKEIGLCETIRSQEKRLNVIETEHKLVKQTVRRYFRWASSIVGGWWLVGKLPEIFSWIRNHL